MGMTKAKMDAQWIMTMATISLAAQGFASGTPGSVVAGGFLFAKSLQPDCRPPGWIEPPTTGRSCLITLQFTRPCSPGAPIQFNWFSAFDSKTLISLSLTEIPPKSGDCHRDSFSPAIASSIQQGQ